jgi:ATP-dependent Clp protease ATP-binding subunit ClpA
VSTTSSEGTDEADHNQDGLARGLATAKPQYNAGGGERSMTVELERMGRCARVAWELAVETYQRSPQGRPGVTTGHLALGVLRQETCASGLILGKLGLDLRWATALSEFVLQYGRRQSTVDQSTVEIGGIPHTVAAQMVLELSDEEANHYSTTYPIGTEHLLLALLRVPDGMGYHVLQYCGLEERKVRVARDSLWEVLRSPE